MSTPLISIAMPFYNAERTIGASIRNYCFATTALRMRAASWRAHSTIRASCCGETHSASNWERA
jgi:hypothetical protein